MSENKEPKNLELFSNREGKQLNELAFDQPESDYSLETDRVPCTSYAPGHHFHWIPIFRYSEPRIPVTVGWKEGKAFVVEVEGKTEIWYHHEPERLKEALQKADPESLRATTGRPWLFVGCGNGAFAFNCSTTELEECKS